MLNLRYQLDKEVEMLSRQLGHEPRYRRDVN